MSATHGIGGDPDDALRLAERVIEAAQAAGADEAEALVVGSESALTRFANSEIHQNVASAEVYVNLRFVKGCRIGVANTGRMDAEGIRSLVERASTIAANVNELEDWPGLPSAPAPAPLPEAYSARTAEASPELRAEGARAVIAAADEAGVTAFGSFSQDAEAVAVATTTGIRAAERRTTSQLLTVTMGPDKGTGYAEQCAVDATTIDAAAIGREAAELARASANPVELEPGDYPVVLTSYAVVDVLDMLGYLGFTALAVQEDRSFWEAGRRVGSPLVSVVDDGRDPAGLPDRVRRRGRAEAAAGAARRRRVPRPPVRRPDRRPRRAARPPATACPPRTRTARSRSTWSWRAARRRSRSSSAASTAASSSRASGTPTRSTRRRSSSPA